mmetsp:Transcript_94321/g.262467  ORF Transcript_94321/g.262467 Transcript_94321/m.262467 type:complete len:209 (-) Transcript_94321:338-964(-)
MVERHVRRDAGSKQLIDEAVVEGNGLWVDAVGNPPGRHKTRPRYAEAVVPHTHRPHQGNIGPPHVVVVTRDVPCGALVEHGLVHRARGLLAAVAAVSPRHAHRVRPGESVPNGGPAAILAVRTLDLVCCSAHAPYEAMWERAIDLVRGRPMPRRVWEWILRARIESGARCAAFLICVALLVVAAALVDTALSGLAAFLAKEGSSKVCK